MVVSFYGSMLKHTGGIKTYKPENSPNVRQLIDEMGCHFGAEFRDFLISEEFCIFLVNGKSVAALEGLSTRLNPGDKIEILPFIEAG